MKNAASIPSVEPGLSAPCLDSAQHFLIEQFLFREAGLLDRRDYRAWLALLADDVMYRVMAQVHRTADLGPLPYAVIDENAMRLKARVEQIVNPKLTHAENPPTLTRRFVSNVTAAAGERDGEFVVNSNILIFRTRPDLPDGALYAGERTDLLRSRGASFCLARREVRLDQAVLRGNISTLF